MKPLVVVGILFLSTACAYIPVTTDFDDDWDFSTVSSYAWLEPKQKLVTDPLVDNDLMNQRIRRSVEDVLNARGMKKIIDSTNPDFLVSYHVTTKEKLSVSRYFSRFGYYPFYSSHFHRGGFGYSDVSVRQYTAGLFVIDVIDPETKQLVWHGVSERHLDTNSTPQQRDEYVSETIRAILDKFPPKPSELSQG